MKYSTNIFKRNMEDNSFNLKKIYGQNFIIDENTINRIIEISNIDRKTLVIEIGPGAGSLTYKLCDASKFVLCYEIDESLKELLSDNLSEKKNFKIIYNDFLKCDVLEDIKNYEYEKLYVVANLPYYITTPIIMKFIEEHIPVDKLVVMVQKEVGDRFKAKVNCKDYNSLSVFLSCYFDVRKVLDVSRNIFIPKPNVDSIVLELTKKRNSMLLNNEELFFKLIRDSFKQKRKTLRNNLRGYDFEKIMKILSKYGFDNNVRAEQIDINKFVEIANSLYDKN